MQVYFKNWNFKRYILYQLTNFVGRKNNIFTKKRGVSTLLLIFVAE